MSTGLGELKGHSSNSNKEASSVDAAPCVPNLHVVCGVSTPLCFTILIFPVELK